MKLILSILTLCVVLFATEHKAIITKVVDGDTLHVTMNGKEEKIRILYIDTPEKYDGAKMDKDTKNVGISVKDEQELGKLATGYAMKFFKLGDTVTINTLKKDRYGRTLATVNKNGIDYSTKIIRDGYACIYKKASYPKELDNVLSSAKDGKKGLWGLEFEVMNRLCR